jgi:ferrous iron transport protein A
MNAPSFINTRSLASAKPLSSCPKYTRGRISALSSQPLFGSHDEQVTLRLKELGFLPGAELQVIGFGLFGRDPIAVRINGTKFALRQAEAAKIMVSIQPQ